MVGLAAVARPLVLTLIGEKWSPSIIYLQILCFVGMFNPLHALNLEMLQVRGRSDLYLHLEIIKKIIAIPVIIIGVFYGIKAMLCGMIVNTLIAYYLNSYWSGRLINYSLFEQIQDILPSFLLALLIGSIMFFESLFIIVPPLALLIIQVISGVSVSIGLCEFLKMKDYLFLKEIVLHKFFNINKR
jgi:O-antigen/teichoic acid export membrane protein